MKSQKKGRKFRYCRSSQDAHSSQLFEAHCDKPLQDRPMWKSLCFHGNQSGKLGTSFWHWGKIPLYPVRYSAVDTHAAFLRKAKIFSSSFSPPKGNCIKGECSLFLFVMALSFYWKYFITARTSYPISARVVLLSIAVKCCSLWWWDTYYWQNKISRLQDSADSNWGKYL